MFLPVLICFLITACGSDRVCQSEKLYYTYIFFIQPIKKNFWFLNFFSNCPFTCLFDTFTFSKLYCQLQATYRNKCSKRFVYFSQVLEKQAQYVISLLVVTIYVILGLQLVFGARLAVLLAICLTAKKYPEGNVCSLNNVFIVSNHLKSFFFISTQGYQFYCYTQCELLDDGATAKAVIFICCDLAIIFSVRLYIGFLHEAKPKAFVLAILTNIT